MVGKWLGRENWVGTWLENSEELVGKWLEKLFRNDWKNHWEKGRWLGNEREMIANRSEDGWNMLYKQFLNGGCIGYTTLVGKSVLGIWLYVIPYIVSPYLIYSGNMCISACVCLCVCVCPVSPLHNERKQLRYMDVEHEWTWPRPSPAAPARSPPWRPSLEARPQPRQRCPVVE